jgi:hypothetical protein
VIWDEARGRVLLRGRAVLSELTSRTADLDVVPANTIDPSTVSDAVASGQMVQR